MWVSGFVIGVVVFLLWRMLAAQEERARTEASRTRVEAARLAVEVAAMIDRRFGTPEQAQANEKLIEYYEATAEALRISDEEMRDSLRTRANARCLRALAVESVKRSRPCRFLESTDFEALRTHYPGPRPSGEPNCDEMCEAAYELTYPPGLETCPFCNGTVTVDAPSEAEIASWHEDNEAWQVWKRHKPGEAMAEESWWRENDAQWRAKVQMEFEAALAFEALVDQ